MTLLSEPTPVDAPRWPTTWRREAGLGVALIVLAWFLPLGTRHLLPSDEGRYAEIAREMLGSGDWITIRYNDLKYFEKPPFQMWMTAIAYAAFGIGEWQARLWVAVGGLIGLAATVAAAGRWYGPRVAILSGLVLLATPSWNLAAHFNSLDMGVSAALTCVLAGVLIAQHPSTSTVECRNWMWFAWAAMAVGVLTKGLIGIVLPGLVLVVYTLLARDWRLWQRIHLARGSLVFVAVTAPWFVLVSQRNPEFLSFFFVHEHFQRFTAGVDQRDAPWWTFVPQLLAGFMPWLGLSWRIGAVVREDARADGFKPALLLGVWAVAILVFFSFSASKLPGYIVPVFPALAILAALALDKLRAAQWRRFIIAAMVVVAVGFVCMPLLAKQGTDASSHALFRSFAGWLSGVLALTLAGLALAWRWNRKSVQQSIAVYALAMFGLVTAGLMAHETFGRKSSGVELVATVQKVLTPAMPLYGVRLLDHTLPFYLRHTTIMVERPGELEFGTQQEPQKWLPTLDAFVNVWRSGPHAMAIMSPETYDLLNASHVAMVPLAADTRRVVVTNFVPGTP